MKKSNFAFIRHKASIINSAINMQFKPTNFSQFTFNKFSYSTLFNSILNKPSFSKTSSRNTFLSNNITQHKPSFSLYSFQSFGVGFFRKRNIGLKKINVKGSYKMKDRKTLRKRLRIIGPSFNRMYAFRRTNFHHKRRRKSSRNKHKPLMKLVSSANFRFIKRNLPYHKTRKCKYGRKF